MKAKNKSISIRTRILLVIITILLVVISSIAIIFNLLVSSYIKTSSINQLNKDIEWNLSVGKGESDDNTKSDISKTVRSLLNIRTQVFKVDSSYNIISSKQVGEENDHSFADISNAIKKSGISPENLDSDKIETSNGTYYVSARVTKNAAEYNIYYVDVTAIEDFEKTINWILLLIMAVAVMLSVLVMVFVINKITNPLRYLAEFSKRMGKGDFTPSEQSFRDRELVELAQSMNCAAVQLGEYDKEQKIFFQNASHELRTPLMSIKCYAEGIVYDVMDKNSAAQTILAETDRLSEMVEDLLMISRIDNINEEQSKCDCDLRELLSVAEQAQHSVILKKNINIIFDFDSSPVLMRVNDKAMVIALSNLISNAVRYAKTKIVLTCKKNDNQIVLAVTDDGEGISQEDMPHIFERFYKGKQGNHGIGLSIVKGVIAQHGGRIEVSSEKGNTKFTLIWNID